MTKVKPKLAAVSWQFPMLKEHNLVSSPRAWFGHDDRLDLITVV